MPIYIAPKFKKPILLVVGSEDDRAPKWMAKKNYDALPLGNKKRLSVFEGTGHGGMQSPHIIDSEKFKL